MNELANTKSTEISLIESLGLQARALRLSINANMWSLARVFVEAKTVVPHGEWQKWLEENADVSVRTAEDMIAAWRRFGGRPQFEGLEKVKVFKLLPLPAEKEEQFLAENDVAHMSTREIQAAVKQARAEAQLEIERERAARIAAEERAKAAESRPPEMPDEMIRALQTAREDAATQRAEVQRLADVGRESIEEQQRLQQENSVLRAELRERDEMLEEQQADYNRMQAELLSAKSAMARGDAEREVSDDFTPEAFTAAVRTFIGACARMPHMARRFAVMGHDAVSAYDEALSAVEHWAMESRRALDTVSSGEVVVASV